jgi:dTDP-4-amino-4,6-dideoxygalactose transaminase
MDAIPFLDIQSEYRELRGQIDAAIARVLDTTQFVLGKEVTAFEEEFAAYCEVPYAVGVNSGTSALHLALLAVGVGPGDEVITSPFTFFAPVAAIRYVGAVPVLVDIEPRTFNLDASHIEAAITPRTRAIIPVHLYGQPAEMDRILDIARRHKLVVIEDAAQAHGAEYHGRRAGSLGDLGCFSFYPTKNLGAPGEGGMVVTSNPEYVRTIRMLRDCGQEQKYHPVLRGYNYRLQGLQAAVLRVKLRRLEAWIEARRANAAQYDRLLQNSEVITPFVPPDVRHVFHLYTVRTAARDEVRRQLEAQGVQTAVHYPAPIHLLPAYIDPRYRTGDFPVSEAAAREVLSLPVHPFLTAAQIERVAQRGFAANGLPKK